MLLKVNKEEIKRIKPGKNRIKTVNREAGHKNFIKCLHGGTKIILQ